MEPFTIMLIVGGSILLLGLVIGFIKSRSASRGEEIVSFEHPVGDTGPTSAGEDQELGSVATRDRAASVGAKTEKGEAAEGEKRPRSKSF